MSNEAIFPNFGDLTAEVIAIMEGQNSQVAMDAACVEAQVAMGFTVQALAANSMQMMAPIPTLTPPRNISATQMPPYPLASSWPPTRSTQIQLDIELRRIQNTYVMDNTYVHNIQ